jgi:hypothetical protein
MAAFIPGASPPLVRTAIFLMMFSMDTKITLKIKYYIYVAFLK